MKINVVNDYQKMSEKAAVYVARRIISNPKITLGLPTGDTPKGLYKHLIRFYEGGLIDFSKACTFNLDEYYPLSPNNPSSFTKYLQDRFYEHVNIPDDQIHLFDGEIDSPHKECQEYEKSLQNCGGIDLAILGIGRNGHIAYNEPGSNWGSRTRLVQLRPTTVKESAPRINGDKIDKAMTVGVRTIMESTKILLLASGEEKAEIMEKTVNGSVTSEVPASILKLHPAVTVYVDKPAAEKI